MPFKCVRCSNTVSTKGGRCKKCLAKLRTTKKTPGHPNHLQKLADDALRRQKGHTATSTAKSKGIGSRHEIINAIKAGYKKYGLSTTLSPDRKDNSKGYSASNVRAVPLYLNRGRHHVDSKKLKAWKEKVKKSNLDPDSLQKAVIRKAYELELNDLAIALETRPNFIKKILK